MHRFASIGILLAHALTLLAADARAGNDDAGALTTDPGWRFALDFAGTEHNLPDYGVYDSAGLQLDAISQRNGWLALVSRAYLDRGRWISESDFQPPHASHTFAMWNASATEAVRACAFGFACLEVGLGVGFERSKEEGASAQTELAGLAEARGVLQIPITARFGIEGQAGLDLSASGTDVFLTAGVVFR